jgi:predicted nucleotidyltransferase
MDKSAAIKISKEYLQRVKNAELGFSEAWLFGSYAKGNQQENSDIDLAIILNENIKHTFELEVMLMVMRKNEETLIEPHPFSKDEFDTNMPIVNQILKFGERIEF